MKLSFNSKTRRIESLFIFSIMRFVNTPVPGPSSTITFAFLKSIDSSIFFARKDELGAIAPTIFFSRQKLATKLFLLIIVLELRIYRCLQYRKQILLIL